MRMTPIFAGALWVVLAGACLIAGPQGNLLAASGVSTPDVQEQSDSRPAADTFSGRIVSQNGDRFILRDDVNEVWYHLDDQQQAAKFFGKDVTVKGVLDGPTDMIHVRSISEAKG
jgi:Protein of unknown function (DUF5818)